ncbi:MAG TPA: carboxypeptidase-like regulatory domain-containing protein, partial [Ferruginibacter sp.]|nr:carboxypeptidase-like regulatory domain-containing protein [Ferruginibacter sp.]
ASITIKGTNFGVQGDAIGKFKISVRSLDDILVVSAVGFQTREIRLSNFDFINVILYKTEQELQEVVVTALGITRKMSSYSTSSSSLAGMAAGVSVNANDIGFKTWKRSGIEENSVKLSIGDKDFLPLKNVQVAVQIDGFRARILFDYFFYNDRDKQLRGDFKLKLPAGASPFYFAFGGTEYINTNKSNNRVPFIDYSFTSGLNLIKDTIRNQRNNKWNNTKEAIVAPKEKAAFAFNEVVRGNIDPALLEWAGADVFSCSVFPLQKNKLHRIVIGYDINLLEIGVDAALNLLLPYDKIEKKLDIDIANTPGLVLEVQPGIQNKRSIAGRVKYHIENFSSKEFTISLRTTESVFLQNVEDDKYFAVSVKPEIPTSATAGLSGDAIFLLDVSLSSQPDKFNVWLKTMEAILNNNRKSIERFAVLYFNVDATWWREYYSINNGYNVDSFLSYANNLSLLGATDISNALKKAANPGWISQDKSIAKTIFLLSDGDASWGENNLFQLSGLIPPGDRVYTFTTGFSETDTRVLDHLSRQTNGAVFSVLNEDEVDKAGVAIQSVPWRIKNISLDGGKDILIAGRPHFVFPGQKLVITGRGKVNKNSVITLLLEQGNNLKTYNIQASQILNSALATRIYGQVAVNQLEDFSFKTDDASIKYATHFEIPGQTCSLIMLESKAMYQRFGLDSLDTKKFIDSTFVTDIIKHVLAEEKSSQTLGSAKADLNAWITKMKKDDVLNIKADSLFSTHFNSLPEASFAVNVKSPRYDIYTNDKWFAGTLNQVGQSILDYDGLMRMINMEKKLEGKGNAFKLISSFAEKNRGDLTLLREVAYNLSNWDLDGKAYELLKRIVLARPAEPATYTLIANSLVKMNYPDLAMVYYDIAYLTEWDDRFDGFNLIAAIQYARLLKDISEGKYIVSNKSFAEKRRKDVNLFLEDNNINSDAADLMIVITWNTDNTDVDLHLREPSGEECFYSHPSTASGGFLSNDATEGFGPEMYFLKKAPPGKYHLDIDYYLSSSIRTSSQSKIMVSAYKNWGRPNEEHIQKIISLKHSEKDKRKRTKDEENDDDNEKRYNDVLVIEF